MMQIKRNVLPSSEEAEQAAVIDYCAIKNIPVVHIPNEGKRSPSYGAKLKRMGLKKGFPDLFFPIPRGGYHGLFIEMKYGKGKLSDDQKEWLQSLSDSGYACYVCYGADEAIRIIKNYSKMKEGNI